MAILRFGGGKDGIKAYLEDGKKQGRELSRDELDQRIILDGDLELTDKIIHSMETDAEKYDHLTLSFKESQMTPELLALITLDVKKFAFGAYTPEELNFYAEAHMPKIKSERKWNSKTKGYEIVERLIHIHMVIPKVNLFTGQRAAPFEMLKARYASQDKTVDFCQAIQERINDKYNLASPLDNLRDDFTNEADMLSRIKDDDFTGRNSKHLIMIRNMMIGKRIESPEAFKTMLQEIGTVAYGNKGKVDEYLKVKLFVGGDGKHVRLDYDQFKPEFIKMPIAEKIAFYKTGGKRTPEERAEDAIKFEKLLGRWNTFRAREIKYLSPSSKLYKEFYAKATDAEKIYVLDKLEAAHYAKLNSDYGYSAPLEPRLSPALAQVHETELAAAVDRNISKSKRVPCTNTTSDNLHDTTVAERLEDVNTSFWDAAITNLAAENDQRGIEAQGSEKLNQISRRTIDEIREADKAGERIIDEPAEVIAALTFSQSTFSEAALEKHLLKRTADAEQYEAALHAVLHHPELVVHRTDKGLIFTSHTIVAIERNLVWRAERMSARNRPQTRSEIDAHLASPAYQAEQAQRVARAAKAPKSFVSRIIASIFDDHGSLHDTPSLSEFGSIHETELERIARGIAAKKPFNSDQRAAFDLLCSDRTLGVVNGAAGTGKSFVLAAMYEANTAAGFKTYGAILMGKTAEDLERDSGIPSRTISRMLIDLKKGKLKLDDKSIIIVDEAGMVGSRDLEKLMAYVEAAGARIRLVGDAKQLAGVEFGNAFIEVSKRAEVVSLTQIIRQKTDWMLDASEKFSVHDISGLKDYADHGHVTLADTVKDAQISIVQKWDEYRVKNPKESIIVLAHTNVERIGLNQMMRDQLKGHGALQNEIDVVTSHGIIQMAVGEKVMFTRGDKEMGVKNGTTGTVENISSDGTISVRLENGKITRFNASGEGKDDGNAVDYGYCVTVYKSQGMTVSKALVLANSSMSLENLYVAMTRHKYDVELVGSAEQFDSIEDMIQKLDRAGRKEFSAAEGVEWTSTIRPEDSRIGQLIAEMNAEKVIRQAAMAASYKEIKANLDATRLLDYLSKSHSLIPEQYSITTDEQGAQLINTHEIMIDHKGVQTISAESINSYDVVQFMTKEMHLNYKAEALPVLKHVYAEQLQNDYSIPRGQVIDQHIKHEFVDHLKARDAEYKIAKEKLDAEKRSEKSIIEKSDLPPAEKKLAQAGLAERIKLAKVDLKKENSKPEAEVYKSFLASKAQTSDRHLQELWRVSITKGDKLVLAKIENTRAAALELARTTAAQLIKKARARTTKPVDAATPAPSSQSAQRAVDVQQTKKQRPTDLGNAKRAAAPAAEVPAAVPIPIQLETSAIQSKVDQDTLLAQFKPMGEATSDQLKTGSVVGAVDGLVVLHVGRGSYVSHKLPAGAALPTVGQELNQQQRSGITR
jgi:Ti-type conjugative transfer relaxase TraA